MQWACPQFGLWPHHGTCWAVPHSWQMNTRNLASVLPHLVVLASSGSPGGASIEYGPRGLLGLGVVVQQVRRARLGRFLLLGDLGAQLSEEIRAVGVTQKLNRLPVQEPIPSALTSQE